MNTENLGTDIANDAGQNDEQIGVDDLRIGMFVSSLDRPWLNTPFLLQGFLVENEKELAQHAERLLGELYMWKKDYDKTEE